jgi:hypothetical protein
MKIFKITLLSFLLISLLACNEKNGIYGVISDNPQSISDVEFANNNFGTEANRDFIGQVVDINNLPISNVLISVGDSEVETDNKGMFIILNALVHSDFAFLKANKAGFFQGSATLIPNEGTNRVKIVLLKNTVTKTINTGEESLVSVLDGGFIKFEGNFEKLDGTKYEGRVNVSVQQIDADSKRLNNIVGMPYALGVDGMEQYLESYGILGVVLSDIDGNPLYLAKDTTAEIMIPVVGTMFANAPSNLSLWYFDKEHGYWKIDGEATLIGSVYKGNVKHISFWNFAQNYRARTVYANITSENKSVIIANQPINLTYESGNKYPFNTLKTISNASGRNAILIPADKKIDYKVLSHNICGSSVLSTTSLISGRLDQHIELALSETNSSVEIVEGTFTNCDGNAVQEGYVYFEMGESVFYNIIKNGEYNINLFRCNSATNFSIEAFDYLNESQKSINMNYLFNNGISKLGELMTCNSVNEMIQFSIDGGSTEKVLITNQVFAQFSHLHPLYLKPYATIFDRSGDAKFTLFGVFNESPSTLGIYDNYELGSATDIGMNIEQNLDMSNVNNNIVYSLVKVGNVDEFIDIHFNGDYEDTSGNAHSIVGLVHVKRDQ